MDFTDADADGGGGSETTATVVDDRPPAPDSATAEDIERYNFQWAKQNGPFEAGLPNGTDATMDLPFAKQLEANTKTKYPWLYDPQRGVRWDFDPVQLRNLAQENTWVGMLVQTITKEVAETPWTITKAEGPITETRKRLQTHPEERQSLTKADGMRGLPDATAEEIARLLMSPNPDQDWHDFVEMILGDLLEVGSGVTVKAFSRQAYDENDVLTRDPELVRPQALKPTAPEVWTKGYQGKTGVLDAFYQFDRERSPGTGDSAGGTTGSRGYQTPIKFDTPEVMWTDMSPRTNRRYGMPPTLLVEDFLQSLDLALTQEQQYLSRGSIPSGAWVFEQWDRQEVKEWKEENAENIKGKPHKSLMFAGRGGDVRFEPMSMNFSELEFTERMKWYARVVASAFQVPTAVVGIEPERVNYNTFQGERENFESNTLGPYLQKLERYINDQLVRPHWGEGYHFEFKPGMSESTRKMISDRVRGEFNSGVIRRNEARREIGRDPVEDEFDGFQDEVVEGTTPEDAQDALGEMVAGTVDKATDMAVQFTNAGGDPFETTGAFVEFLEALDSVAEGGVFVDGQKHPEISTDPAGESIRAVGITEREAKAVWAQFRDGAVALSGPSAIDETVDTVDKAEYDVGGETIDLTPPDYMVAAAEAGQNARDEFDGLEDCGTGVGNDRARAIINDEVGPDVVDEIAAYLTSHEEDVADLDGNYTDWTEAEWTDGCGPLQYALWGGTGDGRSLEWAQERSDMVAEARGEEPTYKHVGKDWSPGGSGNASESVRKEDPLRNTDDWAQFNVQPEMVDDLQADIANDVRALFDAVLDSDEVLAVIDRLAGDGEDTEKSLTELGRVLRDIFTESDIVARIEDAISDHTTDAARAAIESAVEATDEDPDVDVDAIEAQLRDREVAFADRFADEISEDIRDTVGDGWAEGKNTREIAEDIAEQADINEGWTGAERIARQELHIATGEARSEFAGDIDKIEVWQTSEDRRVRPAHEDMNGLWKRPGDDWVVDYSEEGRGVMKESVPGDSEPGIGCRCTVLLRDIDEVDSGDYAGDGSLN